MSKILKGNNNYYEINGNYWSKNSHTEDEVKEISKNMINCKNCLDCEDCRNCVNCFYCKDCVDCQFCQDCSSCQNCKSCIHSNNLLQCKYYEFNLYKSNLINSNGILKGDFFPFMNRQKKGF